MLDIEKLNKVRDYIRALYIESENDDLVYHSFSECSELADLCLTITEGNDLSEDDAEVLILAGWFLHSGYTVNAQKPINESKKIAEKYLKSEGYSEQLIEKVSDLIGHSAKKPETDLQRYFHDARWAFVGRKRFFRKSELWRLEEENILGEKVSLNEWEAKMLDLLVTSRFYTPWAVSEYADRKDKNILKQRSNITKTKKIVRRKKTGKDFGRGIDTLYRNTLRGHLNLSAIADGKANMIISINTLILSILITAGSASVSYMKFNASENLHIIVPVLILMLSSLSATIFAVFSAIPKYSPVSFTMEDVKKHKVSLVFFNNFLNIDKEQFVEYLRDLKKDETLLYDDLARDVYNLGGVLKKKYYLLNIAYKLFIGGLALSFLAFVITLMFSGPVVE